MRFKSYFVICAVSFLSACAAPEFPKGPICTLVWNETLDKSYGFCAPWDQPRKGARISAEDLFKQKYIAVDPVYFSQIMQWKRDMEDYAKSHCQAK